MKTSTGQSFWKADQHKITIWQITGFPITAVQSSYFNPLLLTVPNMARYAKILLSILEDSIKNFPY